MSPAVKNGIMLVILVAVLAGAGWFFYRGGAESRYDDTEESMTSWMCTKCGWRVDLTSKEQQEWLNSQDKVKREPGLKQIIFWCPNCQDFLVTRAEECRRHPGVWYCTRDINGNLQNCPECQKEVDAGEW